jgi:hypothetical protein
MGNDELFLPLSFFSGYEMKSPFAFTRKNKVITVHVFFPRCINTQKLKVIKVKRVSIPIKQITKD